MYIMRSPEFAVQAASEDATGVSALQIWNAERNTMGLEPITIEQLAPHLQKVAQFENLLTRDDKTRNTKRSYRKSN